MKMYVATFDVINPMTSKPIMKVYKTSTKSEAESLAQRYLSMCQGSKFDLVEANSTHKITEIDNNGCIQRMVEIA